MIALPAWPADYAMLTLSWEIVNGSPWEGFRALEKVRRQYGWPALEVFAHTVEYGGIRVTVRRPFAPVRCEFTGPGGRCVFVDACRVQCQRPGGGG